jgi:diguanylate cyclase (GGDEF)-like protein
VFALIVFVSTLNLLLGIGAAVVLTRETPDIVRLLARVPLPWLQRFLPVVEPLPDNAAETAAPTPNTEGETVTGLDIPPDWIELLAPHSVRPRTLWEAALCCLHIRLTQYLPAVTTAERRLRTTARAEGGGSPSETLKLLGQRHEPWRAWLQSMVEWMSRRRATIGVTEEQERVLEEKLLECAELASLTLRLPGVHGPSTPTLDPAVLPELNRDLAGLQTLRDLVLESLSQVFASEQRWPELSLDWLYDPHTGLRNRLGFKTVVHEWLQADPNRTRLMSLMFVQCDRVSRWNERLGAAGCDDLIRGFAQRVSELIRNDRGDRAIRFSGTMIAVLLADAGAAGGRCAAERIRQTIEATLFQLGSEEFALSANCAVTEFFLDDNLSDAVRRLHEGIKEARKAGRNRTAIDEGNGPKVFEAIPMTIPGKSVVIEPMPDTEL